MINTRSARRAQDENGDAHLLRPPHLLRTGQIQGLSLRRDEVDADGDAVPRPGLGMRLARVEPGTRINGNRKGNSEYVRARQDGAGRTHAVRTQFPYAGVGGCQDSVLRAPRRFALGEGRGGGLLLVTTIAMPTGTRVGSTRICIA